MVQAHDKTVLLICQYSRWELHLLCSLSIGYTQDCIFCSKLGFDSALTGYAYNSKKSSSDIYRTAVVQLMLLSGKPF